MGTQFYKRNEAGDVVRYKSVGFTLHEIIAYAKKIGIRIAKIEDCPLPEHDKIAWLKDVNEGFGFNVLPEPEKTLKPKQRRREPEMEIGF